MIEMKVQGKKEVHYHRCTGVHMYGSRWLAEIVFSLFKRRFGQII